MNTNLLTTADLLAGSKAQQEITIPSAVLQPAASGAQAATAGAVYGCAR